MSEIINEPAETIVEVDSKPIEKPTILHCIFRIVFGIAFLLGVIFGVAGTLNWQSGWIYFSANVIFLIASVPVMYIYNPEMLKRKFPKDTKRFDKIFLAVYIPIFYSEIIIAALGERFDVSGEFSLITVIAASVFYTIAFTLWLWAVAKNNNFEMTVRIQHDRGHKVCSSGPYKFVRHPAYTAGVIMFVATPIALSSLWALIPAGVLVIALLIRTKLEDDMLINELDGYKEFTEVTKYRIIPFVW